MRAGNKDRRITIQQLTTSKNGFGEDVEAWALQYSVWAEVRPVQGDEKFGADQRTSEAFTNFKIDYITGITTSAHRIIYEGNTYDIRYTQEIGRREALLITGKAQGV
jgi:SPP1 family predicted phage head-tail adaptor